MSRYYKIDSNGNEVVVETGGLFSSGVAIAVATVLTAEDSGKTFYLAAAGKAITLPGVATKANYKFICKADIITTAWIITAATKVISGSAQVAGAVVAAALEDVVTIVHTKALIGDWVSLESDGTNWYVEGSAVTAGAITFTGAL